MKKCFVDIETTGLGPWRDDDDKDFKGVILSVGLILETGESLETIITPTIEEWGFANPIALQVNGMKWDFLKENGIEFADAVSQIITWLKDHNINNAEWEFVAQNAPFDRKFLLHFMGDWLRFIDAPETWIDFIPIYKNFGARLGLNISRQNQKHIALQLGVPPEADIHEALEGAKSLKRNYDELKRRVEEKGWTWPV